MIGYWLPVAGVTPAMLPGRRHSGDAAVSRKLQPASQRGSVPCLACTWVPLPMAGAR